MTATLAALVRPLLVVFVCLQQDTHGFSTTSPIVRRTTAFGISRASDLAARRHRQTLSLVVPERTLATTGKSSSTTLYMYNLPPGKNNNDNEIVDILKGVAGFALVVAFFASPLGGFVLGIFNSFLVLSILLPILGAVGFQVWQYFNTISGPCPNCAAPARVLKSKDGESVPGVCYNCGAILQANYDNTAIDNVTGRNSINDDDFGGMASIFDIFGAGPGSYTTTTTIEETTIFEDSPKDRSKNNKFGQDDTTIIDVEVEDKEKPWQ